MGWGEFFYLVAVLILTVALTPKVQPPQPEAFDQIDFPQADEGTPQAVIFGDCWSGDWTVLDVGAYRTEAVISDGGKK